MATTDGKETWHAFPEETSSASQKLQHCPELPYTTPANALQNTAVWTKPPSSASSSTAPWIVYIHGGAWRDPKVWSASFTATVTHIAKEKPALLASVGGFASLNYSLSPHPAHPNPERDPSRTATHPQHIADVLQGLAFLQQRFLHGAPYVLAGHSCGATLALQTVMDRARLGLPADAPPIQPPAAILGLNGLYDLPTLIRDPGATHEKIQPIYEAFTRGAFGDDEEVWKRVSPLYEEGWHGWKAGDGRKRVVVLTQSHQDSLVPYRQTRDMLEALRAAKLDWLEVGEDQATGDHNALWEQGVELGDILERVVGMM